MINRKKVLVIIGSAGEHSANQKLMEQFAATTAQELDVTIFTGLKTLPHFDPELSGSCLPAPVQQFRAAVEATDGLIICTPEYVFSIPAGLKNAIEWCVATTVFSNKPMGLITAAAQGEKGHEQLQLIMKTVMAQFTRETTLLIQGIKGKIRADGTISDPQTKAEFEMFLKAFQELLSADMNAKK